MSREIVFNINPCAKPRMTRSDKWKTRPATKKYWSFKRHVEILALLEKYKVAGELEIEFQISMPNSWSKKKKLQMEGEPHESRPDLDNLLKAWADCLCEEDSFIHTIKAKKTWADAGSIIVKT